MIGAVVLTVIEELSRASFGGTGRGTDTVIYAGADRRRRGVLSERHRRLVQDARRAAGARDGAAPRRAPRRRPLRAGRAVARIDGARCEHLLELRGVSKRFGGLVANEDVSFDVDQGQIVGLIGPNGAGKTTLFNCVAGSSAPSDGTIRLDGRLISGLTPEKCARAGVGRTFQIARTFHGMTALENVLTGALLRERRVAQARERARRVARVRRASNASPTSRRAR